MIVYLDQNKWIELAKMFHGKDNSIRASRVLREYEEARKDNRIQLPLSSIHYIETSRISNTNRRVRLGAAMWHFSGGASIIGYQAIVRHELELALAKHLTEVNPGSINILGRGHAHAFCSPPLPGAMALIQDEIERSLLMGSAWLGIDPLASYSSTHRENFKQHLSTLHVRCKAVPENLRENWLYAMSTDDILNPLNEVMRKHKLPKETIANLGEHRLKEVIDDMPTRRIDMHLHKQILQNPNYVARSSDLEDWGGIAVASSYCDVVICEKHMADMLRRNRFTTYARIETNIENTFNA